MRMSKSVEPRGAQGFDRQRQDFGFARGAVFQAQQFHAGLEELRGAMRLGGLMAEGQAVVAKPRRKFHAASSTACCRWEW